MESKEIKLEARVKKGLEVLPSLHRELKSKAAARGIPVWQAVDAAFRSWIAGKPVAPSIPSAGYASQNSELHDKLEKILNSGDEGTIRAVVPNIEIFYERLKPTPSKRKVG